MLRDLELGLGARLLIIILFAAVVPLALAGAWLTQDAGRAGEALLEQRMEGALAELSRELGARWLRSRSVLLDLVESPEVLDLLRNDGPVATDPGPARSAPTLLTGIAHEVVVRDLDGREVLRFRPEGPPQPGGLPVTLPVHAPLTGEILGSFEVRLVLEDMLARAPEWTARTGGVLGILEREGERSVLPTPFDPQLMASPRFLLGGEEWITVRRTLSDPPAILVVASPLEPFTEPFREAARRGILLLLAVALTGFGVAALLTRQATRAVSDLQVAAGAVARGELDRRVEVSGPREVRRLARAFNAMAARLERTLDALAKREALAAVGEFASGLAHELRNPLTAIRVDLQRVEEVSDDEERRQALVERMLEAMHRLDRTVSGVLRVAGSGRIRPRPISVGEPLTAALRTARPVLEEQAADLVAPPDPDSLPRVLGDEAALEQLFLNVLLNAAEALEAGGTRRVEVEVSEDEAEGVVLVRVRDTGRGIPPEELERVFEPLYSTKSGGTGLGLAISQRIARAHDGEITIESESGRGTAVTVTLPVADASSEEPEPA